jgi:thiol-disulfide isomerase/thioredoxin
MIRTSFVLALMFLAATAAPARSQEAATPKPGGALPNPAAPLPAAPAPASTPGAPSGVTLTPAAPAGDAKSAAPAKPDIYDEHADGKTQIAAALAQAARNNRRVLIQWGANWCSWCHLLHELCASDGEIKHELLYEYDVVLVDIGHFDKHMDVAASYGADLKVHGVPYLTLLAADGTVIANQETGPLELTKEEKVAGGKLGHDPGRVLGFLVNHQADYLHSQDVYRDALVAAARDGKRVFLHFGAPWCGWCHKLENWMAEPRIAELLGRDFVDCKIDTERTLGGDTMLTRLRGSDQGGIPWYQFVSAEGTVLADSNGADGSNIGFPSAPPELAHFREMLTRAAVHLTPADIDELLATLAPKAEGAAPHAATPATTVPATPATPVAPASAGGH